jgi:myosin heavy subunit
MFQMDSKLIWISDHPEEGWYPGKIINKDENEYTVEDDKQERFVIPRDQAIEVHPSCLTAAPDLLTLGDFNEGSLLHNVRERFKTGDKIYTAVGGPIIISINPYKPLGIYGLDKMKYYKEAVRAQKAGHNQNVEPHLFRIAENSYQAMLESSKNQSIIISGESGAGKTEAAKRILEYLTKVSQSQGGMETSMRKMETSMKKSTSGSENTPGIEDRVLDSNPILEAFGNAKTVRNDNSSRFGKFIEVYFNKPGKIQSANIINYLLEKSRIVSHQPGERNYHIFYQICYGFTEEEKKKYAITSTRDYKYLSKFDQANYDIDTDKEDFEETKKCFDVLGFSEIEKSDLLMIVSAILHIGNIAFTLNVSQGTEGSKVSEETNMHLEVAAKFLGIDAKTLEGLFTTKQMIVGKDVTLKRFKPDDADRNKDALVKDLYGKAFDWLVNRVNISIEKSAKSNDRSFTFGILDIFGFENFNVNSFEQLCINFTNEKLQQHFNNHIFKTEQEEYLAEGVQWKSISFTDNLQTIDLIEKSGLSIFSTLEDQCQLPKGTDSGFVNQVNTKLSSYTPSILPINKFKTQLFGVKHYAGEVFYDSTNFLEKNRDAVNPDLIKAFSVSQNTVVKLLFTESFNIRLQSGKNAKAVTSNTNMKAQTLTYKFKGQLAELMQVLNETNPAYIRCIKPNPLKRAGLFDSIDVQRQLRCAGMLEAIRIRKNGYGVRRIHQDFLDKYRIILNKKGKPSGIEDCKRLFEKLQAQDDLKRHFAKEKGLWAVGKTKVFMKEELLVIMDQVLYKSLKKYILTIQKGARKFLLRKRWKQLTRLFKLKRAFRRTAFHYVNRAIIDYAKCWIARKMYKLWKRNKVRKIFEKLEVQLRIMEKQKLGIKVPEPVISPAESDGSKAYKTEQMTRLKKGADFGNPNANSMIAQLQAALEEKTKENELLKGNNPEGRGTTTRMNDALNNLEDYFGKYGKDDESISPTKNGEETKKIVEMDARIMELRKGSAEKDNKIKLLETQLAQLNKKMTRFEEENKYFNQILQEKKVIQEEKYDLEIQLKTKDEMLQQLQNKYNIKAGEVAQYRERYKAQEQELIKIREELKESNFSNEELLIRLNSVQQQEQFFQREIQRMEEEMKEKIHLIKKSEVYIQDLQIKIQKLSMDSRSSLTLDPNDISSTTSTLPSENSREADALEIQELRTILAGKNAKLSGLTKECETSKEINQTLIRLLKLKNIIIEQNSNLYNDKIADKTEILATLEKFKSEEKKLLRLLDTLMRQLEKVSQ